LVGPEYNIVRLRTAVTRIIPQCMIFFPQYQKNSLKIGGLNPALMTGNSTDSMYKIHQEIVDAQAENMYRSKLKENSNALHGEAIPNSEFDIATFVLHSFLIWAGSWLFYKLVSFLAPHVLRLWKKWRARRIANLEDIERHDSATTELHDGGFLTQVLFLSLD
jgi:hypothetical protein